MIHVYTGKTGSGKTWSMVQDAFREWKRGADIYSNIPLFFEATLPKKVDKLQTWIDSFWPTKKPGKVYYYQHIAELLSVRDGIILMDEAQVLINARNWENLPYEFQWKLQQHRKHRLDLYATCQNMGTIDITMRRLVQAWYHCYPKFWIFHEKCEKDIDQLYNSVDDLVVDTIKSNLFITHPLWRASLYDTYFDLGFERFQLELTSANSKRRIWIYPKNLSLKDAIQSSSTLVKCIAGPAKPPSYSRSWTK